MLNNVPQIRRGKPAAFARPSIDLGGAPVKREWSHVQARLLSVGDTVADFGTVDSKTTTETGRITLVNRVGSTACFPPDHVLRAFTAAR